MKTVISIFCLPQEIDELEQLLLRLKFAFNHVNISNYTIDISLGISDQLTNWEESTLPKQYFLDKFETITNLLPNIVSRTSEDILGCVSQRRYTWKTYQDCDYFIWLDTDIVFDPITLYYLEESFNSIKDQFPLSVITPEIVKVWDGTWDCLVNDKFQKEKYGYEKLNNPYADCGQHGEIFLERVLNQIPGQPPMKFAGGWFTCISKVLLDKITIPDNLGHYGWEDTLIMHACARLGEGHQFKVKNLVVCENYKFRDNSYFTKYIKNIDKREEFKTIAYQGANEYLSKL